MGTSEAQSSRYISLVADASDALMSKIKTEYMNASSLVERRDEGHVFASTTAGQQSTNRAPDKADCSHLAEEQLNVN